MCSASASADTVINKSTVCVQSGLRYNSHCGECLEIIHYITLGHKTTTIFSARCICLCYDVSVRLSVRLSVTKVHWRIIANLGFKFRSKFTAHCGRGACGREH